MAIAEARTRPAEVTMHESTLLRRVLGLDGLGSAANGVAYLAAAGPLADVFGLPTALLVPAGAFLVLYGVSLLVMASRPTLHTRIVQVVVVVNAIWVADSIAVASAGWFDLTTAGVVWVLAQAALVGAFALAQVTGLRRASR